MSLDMLGARSTFDAVQEEAQVVSKHVSPWLWILSGASFAMAVMNWYRIRHMFGSYKSMKDALWMKR